MACCVDRQVEAESKLNNAVVSLVEKYGRRDGRAEMVVMVYVVESKVEVES